LCLSLLAFVICILALFLVPTPLLESSFSKPRRMFRVLLILTAVGAAAPVWLVMRPDRFRRTTVILAAAFFTLGTTIVFSQRINYHSSFDLAAFCQMLYTTIEDGTLLRSSLEGLVAGIENPSHFALHNQAILFFLLPFYAVFPDPLTLDLAHILAYTAAILVFVRITEKQLGRNVQAFLIILAFAAYPHIPRFLFDFHPTLFFPVLFLSAHLALIHAKMRTFYVFIVLSLLCKENTDLCIAGYGLALLCAKEHRKIGGLVATVGAVFFLLNIYVIIPQFRPEGFMFLDRYRHLGTSFGEIFLSFVRNPGMMVKTIFHVEKTQYCFQILYPTAFLCLLRPRWLLGAVPIFLQNVLSSYPGDWSVASRHTPLIWPFLFLATIDGTAWLARRRNSLVPFAVAVLTLVTLTETMQSWPREMETRRFRSDRRAEVTDLRLQVPETASVTASSNVITPFANRRELYAFPEGIGHAEYLALNVSYMCYPFKTQPEFAGALRALRTNADYGAVGRFGMHILFRKGAADSIEWSPPLRQYDAAIVSATFPAAMKCGEVFTPEIVIRNCGTAAWSESDQCRLGTPGEREVFFKRSSQRVRLNAEESIISGATKTFRLTGFRAPNRPGTHRTRWQMVREFKEWFGEEYIQEIVVTENDH
ncbi:MAG: DUF2079 domain-containing protein, partial [bacterium]